MIRTLAIRPSVDTWIGSLYSCLANLAGIAEPDSVEWGNVLKIQKAEQKLRKGTPLKPESQVIKPCCYACKCCDLCIVVFCIVIITFCILSFIDKMLPWNPSVIVHSMDSIWFIFSSIARGNQAHRRRTKFTSVNSDRCRVKVAKSVISVIANYNKTIIWHIQVATNKSFVCVESFNMK